MNRALAGISVIAVPLLRFRGYPALKRMSRLETVPKEEFAQYRLQKLNEVLEYANENSPFYRSLWKEAGVRFQKLKHLDELRYFPVVTKELLRGGYDEGTLIPKHLAGKKGLYKDKTTGSSGEPFLVLLDRNTYHWRVASILHTYRLMGIQNGDRIVRLWRARLEPSFTERVKEAVLGRRTVSIYDPDEPVASAMTDERIKEILQILNSERPALVDGFASALSLIARFMVRNDLKLNFIPKAISCGADTLFAADRSVIHNAFGRPVFNRYGGTESGALAHQCRSQVESDSESLHTLDWNGVIETVESDSGVPVVGTPGEVTFTDFHNHAMPLIRYKNGDIATYSEEGPCPCGRPLGVFASIQGRVNDTFELKNGSKISSHLWHNYMKRSLAIRNYQIQQRTREQFEVLLVVDPAGESDPEFTKVKALVESALPACQVKWTFVNEIPRSAGGKLRQAVSFVSQ